MPAIKITRRIVDPITFVERVGLEFIPRLEDSILDDQLAGSMSYIAPKYSIPSTPAPPPPPPSPTGHSSSTFRPPTPPKTRGKGEHPNSPRNQEQDQVTPSQIRKSLSEKGSPLTAGQRASLSLVFSPRTSGVGRKRASLTQINETKVLDQIQGIMKKENKDAVDKSVRFEDEIQLNEISRLRRSMLEDMFYASEDLANFRYEAFMEELGLDNEDFD